VTLRQISARLSVALLVLIIVGMGTVYYTVVPVVREVEVQTREAILRDTLGQMRVAINKYAAERGQLPNTLDDLVDAKLLTKVPIDPVTETRNWRVIQGTELNGFRSAPGIVDVRCQSSARSSKGTVYSEW
jgi:general secretion pathway protein G